MDIKKIEKAFCYLVVCGIVMGIIGIAIPLMPRSSPAILIAAGVFCAVGMVLAFAVSPLLPMQNDGWHKFESVGWLLLVVAWVCLLWSVDWTIEKRYILNLVNTAIAAASFAFIKHMIITASAYSNWLETSKDI